MILTGTGPGGSGVSVLARVAGTLGRPVAQADVASIAWTLTDLTAGAVVATGAWAVAATILQALQQGDPRWTLDTVARPGRDGLSGYNLLGTIPASAFPLGTPAILPPGYPVPAPHEYQIDVAVTPVSGQPFRITGYYTPEAVVYG